jgi:hypothetical protein
MVPPVDGEVPGGGRDRDLAVLQPVERRQT